MTRDNGVVIRSIRDRTPSHKRNHKRDGSCKKRTIGQLTKGIREGKKLGKLFQLE